MRFGSAYHVDCALLIMFKVKKKSNLSTRSENPLCFPRYSIYTQAVYLTNEPVFTS